MHIALTTPRVTQCSPCCCCCCRHPSVFTQTWWFSIIVKIMWRSITSQSLQALDDIREKEAAELLARKEANAGGEKHTTHQKRATSEVRYSTTTFCLVAPARSKPLPFALFSSLCRVCSRTRRRRQRRISRRRRRRRRRAGAAKSHAITITTHPPTFLFIFCTPHHTPQSARAMETLHHYGRYKRKRRRERRRKMAPETTSHSPSSLARVVS